MATFFCMQKTSSIEPSMADVTVTYSGLTANVNSEFQSVPSYTVTLTPCDNLGIPNGNQAAQEYITDKIIDVADAAGSGAGRTLLSIKLPENNVLYICVIDFTVDFYESTPEISSNSFFVFGNAVSTPTISFATTTSVKDIIDTYIPVTVNWTNDPLSQKCLAIKDRANQSITLDKIQLVTTNNAAIAAVMEGNVVVTPAIPANTIMYNNENGVQTYILCPSFPANITTNGTLLTGFTNVAGSTNVTAIKDNTTGFIWIRFPKSLANVDRTYTITSSITTRGYVKKTSNAIEIGYAPGRPKAPTNVITRLLTNTFGPVTVAVYFKEPTDRFTVENEKNFSQPNGLKLEGYEITNGSSARFDIGGKKFVSDFLASGDELLNFYGMKSPRPVTGNTLRVDGTSYTRTTAAAVSPEVDITGYYVVNHVFNSAPPTSATLGVTAVYKNSLLLQYGLTGVAQPTSLIFKPTVSNIAIIQNTDSTESATGDITLTVSGNTGTNNFFGYNAGRIKIWWGYKSAIDEVLARGGVVSAGAANLLTEITNFASPLITTSPELSQFGSPRSYQFVVSKSLITADEGKDIHFYVALSSDVQLDQSVLKGSSSYTVQGKPFFQNQNVSSLSLSLKSGPFGGPGGPGEVSNLMVKLANVVNFGLGQTSVTALKQLNDRKLEIDSARKAINAMTIIGTSETPLTSNDISNFINVLNSITPALTRLAAFSDSGELPQNLADASKIVEIVRSVIAILNVNDFANITTVANTISSLISLLENGALKTATNNFSQSNVNNFTSNKLAFAQAAIKYLVTPSALNTFSYNITNYGTANEINALNDATEREKNVTVTLGYITESAADWHYVSEPKNYVATRLTGPLSYYSLFDTTSTGGYKLLFPFIPNSYIYVWIESITVKSSFNANLLFKASHMSVNSVPIVKSIFFYNVPGRVRDLVVKPNAASVGFAATAANDASTAAAKAAADARVAAASRTVALTATNASETAANAAKTSADAAFTAVTTANSAAAAAAIAGDLPNVVALLNNALTAAQAAQTTANAAATSAQSYSMSAYAAYPLVTAANNDADVTADLAVTAAANLVSLLQTAINTATSINNVKIASNNAFTAAQAAQTAAVNHVAKAVALVNIIPTDATLSGAATAAAAAAATAVVAANTANTNARVCKYSFKKPVDATGDMLTSYKITYKLNGNTVNVGDTELVYYIKASSLGPENETFEVTVNTNSAPNERGSAAAPLPMTLFSGSPNTITTPIGSYAYGDLIEVTVISIGTVTAGAVMTESMPAKVSMVPSAPATIDSIVITSLTEADGSLDDIVTYNISNNGSALTSLLALDIFGNLLLPTTANPVTTFTFQTSNLKDSLGDNTPVLTNSISPPTSITQVVNREIDVNTVSYVAPTRIVNSGGVAFLGDFLDSGATSFKSLTTQTSRLGAVIPTKTVLTLRYFTTSAKRARLSSISGPVAGLIAQFAVLSSTQSNIPPSQTAKFTTTA